MITTYLTTLVSYLTIIHQTSAFCGHTPSIVHGVVVVGAISLSLSRWPGISKHLSCVHCNQPFQSHNCHSGNQNLALQSYCCHGHMIEHSLMFNLHDLIHFHFATPLKIIALSS